MRLINYLSICLLSILFFGFRFFNDPVYITGHLKKNPKDTAAYIDGIAVIVKGDNKVLAKTVTDAQGKFSLVFTPGQEKSFDFFVYGIAIDTLLVSSITTFESDTPDITFFLPALRRKNTLGQMLCPKCAKTDKVYKIRYGDGLPTATMRISKSGDTTYSPIVRGRYNAGTCIVGIAAYYCHRDKVKF
jgi:hypothetical protein